MYNRKNIVSTSVLFLIFVIFSNLALAQSTRKTVPGYLASTSEDLLDKAIEYAVSKDYVALQKLLDSDLVFMLKGGLEVYIVKCKFFSGKVKIRPTGETIEIWTVIEAVKE